MEFIELELPDGNQFVYRLWEKDGGCLYVGQHDGFHPAARVADHVKNKTWWGDVYRIDYAVVEGDLDAAEDTQIWQLAPRHNKTPLAKRAREREGLPEPAASDRDDYVHAGFLVDEEDWAVFGEVAKARGTTRSAILVAFIRQQIAEHAEAAA
jgi:hypothetical protein